MRTTQSAGKITLLTLLSLVGVFVLASLFDIEYRGHVANVQATSTASTTVTVLNTPPNWTLTARELYASATTTPTNEGTSTVITAIATDNNGESYKFLVCRASGTPTVIGLQEPICFGGVGNNWGISATTTSGSAATVSIAVDNSFDEKNSWYGYICDRNPGDPECNAVMYNGLHESGAASATSSPFVVNHAPTISAASNNGPVDPGGSVIWSATATDTIDVIRGNENLRLFVCKADNFDPAVPSCGAPGAWATSSYSTTGTIATTSVIAIPTQDGSNGAWFFVIDEFGLEATGVEQGSDNPLVVNNVPPTIEGATTFGLYDVFGTTSTDILLALTVPQGETDNFVAQFDVTDDNGCLSTLAANEIQSMDFNVFRSGVGGQDAAGCDGDDTFNANQCYQDTYTGWTPTCYQKPGATCTASTPYVTWECTFPLWFIADPTDVGSQHPTEYWMAAVRATDDGTEGVGPETGPYGTSTTATEMTQFLSFSATGSPIAYGSFEPGFGSTYHPATTTVYATGNTGLDQYLSSDPMCVSYPNCSGAPTNTILTGYQHYSLTNTTLFWSGATSTASTSPTLLLSAIDTPDATSTPADCTLGTASCGNTYWGIYVPGTITFAGDYKGLNYIDAVISDQASW